MKIKTNLHTHTTYCDGKNTCEEMIAAAAELGFESIGLSSHSYVPYDGGFGMTPDAAARYRAEVRGLAKKYHGKINVYTGIEQDICSEPSGEGYDYIIGSVHYIETPGGVLTVDYSADVAAAGVRELFDGDWMRYIRAYYELVAALPERTECDFVGHFDLITKYNEDGKYFDTHSREYRAVAYEALRAVVPECRLFEMNSGAVWRGSRKTPYPDKFILESMRELGCGIIFSSDSHECAAINFMLDEMAALAREAGFKSAFRLTPRGFEEYGI